MGQKLKLHSEDPFLQPPNNAIGISGGCYCCGQQLHINYSDVDTLPTARILLDVYNVIVCDICEDDVSRLEKFTSKTVSYDILFYIQEELKDKLIKLSKKKLNYTEEDRFSLLKSLYSKCELKNKKLKGK